MRWPLGCGGGVPTVAAAFVWAFYAVLQFQNFYDTAVKAPPVQRVAREVKEMQLPHLYLCPADRGRVKGFRWHSYECTLSYMQERRTCPARLQAYRGREPEEFRADKDGDGLTASGKRPGECLEFDTHIIGVREEWSAAWNEISLRASFVPASTEGYRDALQEVELGYLPVEWQIGFKSTTVKRYYYPLLRVPFFFISDDGHEPGVATRSYMGQAVDRGLRTALKYWYTYGATHVAVVNATVPQEILPSETPVSPTRSLGVAHVVLTLEDFEEFDLQVISSLFPLLGCLGQVAGVGAVLAIAVGRPRWRTGRGAGRDGDDGAGTSCASPTGGPEYKRVGPDDEDGSGEEGQALLATSGSREVRRRTEDRPSGSQALLGTEEGLDGL